MTTIELYYDFGSPNAHLVHRALPAQAREAGAEVVYRPVLLGGIFKATDNQSPMLAFAGVKGKLAHQRQEIARFCHRFAIPFKWNPHFPINTLGLMRGAIYAQGKPWQDLYVETCFAALWEREENMGEMATVVRVLDQAGLPTQEILAATQTDPVKKGLIEATQTAVTCGVYGAPMMALGGELFFGKSALDELIWFAAQSPSDDRASARKS